MGFWISRAYKFALECIPTSSIIHLGLFDNKAYDFVIECPLTSITMILLLKRKSSASVFEYPLSFETRSYCLKRTNHLAFTNIEPPVFSRTILLLGAEIPTILTAMISFFGRYLSYFKYNDHPTLCTITPLH
jgi:hypothetical protein